MDVERPRDRPERKPFRKQRLSPRWVHVMKPRPAEPVPLGLGASDPGYHPLPNQAALELGDRRQDVEEKAPCRRRAVQHLIQDNELDSQCFKLASKGEQMPGRSSEPVELHA